MTVKPMKTLIIGGAASGKSAYAEGLASNSKLYKIYLASANIYDEEMQLKVNKHKIRRGDDWTTISEPLEAKEKITNSQAEINAYFGDIDFDKIGARILRNKDIIDPITEVYRIKEEFKKRGLDQLNLSRSLEDGGTLTSPLIPWNTCGAYMHSVLLVNPFDYVFYAFFNVINPILAVVYAYLGIKILRITPPHVEVNSKDTV